MMKSIQKKYVANRAAVLGVLGALALTLAGPMARAEHTRITNPNAVSLEILGRGLLYGLSFDRVVNDDLVAGISFGKASVKTVAGVDNGSSATLVPVYVNYYFAREAGSVYVTAGATLVANSDEVKDQKATYSGLEFSSTPILPTFGLGYEGRSDSGFLFRGAVYGIVGKSLNPWVGFTMGYSF